VKMVIPSGMSFFKSNDLGFSILVKVWGNTTLICFCDQHLLLNIGSFSAEIRSSLRSFST
jgi:hypothetical protein